MKKAIPKLCAFPQCIKYVYNLKSGLCGGHYKQKCLGKNLTPLLGRSGKKYYKACEFNLCERPAVVHRMCDAHYRQFQKGVPLSELKKKNPSGMGSVNPDGYRVISCHGHFAARKDGRLFEHVYVMAEFLGRRLSPNENVHHKNGDKLDNRIENLELWIISQPPGQRVTDLFEWAEYIISTYSDEVQKLSVSLTS